MESNGLSLNTFTLMWRTACCAMCCRAECVLTTFPAAPLVFAAATEVNQTYLKKEMVAHQKILVSSEADSIQQAVCRVMCFIQSPSPWTTSHRPHYAFRSFSRMSSPAALYQPKRGQPRTGTSGLTRGKYCKQTSQSFEPHKMRSRDKYSCFLSSPRPCFVPGRQLLDQLEQML